MSKTVSGTQCIKILCAFFGFAVVSQRGGHVKLRSRDLRRSRTVIVPMHRELAKGTLAGILRMAGVDTADFDAKK